MRATMQRPCASSRSTLSLQQRGPLPSPRLSLANARLPLTTAPLRHGTTTAKDSLSVSVSTDEAATTSTTESISSVDVAASLSETEGAAAPSTRVPWHKKPCDWVDVATVGELLPLLEEPGIMKVLDLYAGWCGSCRTAFPAVCKVPTSIPNANKFRFYKLNIEHEDAPAFLKQYAVRGIPHIMVFNGEGKRIAGFGASFKKVAQAKANLEIIATSNATEFVVNAEGVVEPR